LTVSCRTCDWIWWNTRKCIWLPWISQSIIRKQKIRTNRLFIKRSYSRRQVIYGTWR